MGKGSKSCQSAMQAPDWFEMAGSRKGETYQLIEGVLDDQARWAFTRGSCHSFALALSEQTGWPMLAIVGDSKGFAEHVVVEMPDGRWLDASGPQQPQARRGYHAEIWSKQQVELLGEHKNWLAVDVEAASSFVGPLLASF